MKNYVKKEIDKYENICYFNNKNQRHRTDGPAVVWSNGSESWWVNGKCHRLDGPAIIWVDGDKVWRVNDKLHRLDGPAIVLNNGFVEWGLCGIKYTKSRHNRLYLFFALEPSRIELNPTEE
jgi:hypothetical protein